jgi:hypothetical protein
MIKAIYKLFCEICRMITGHRVRDAGEWEIYTCEDCGAEKSYRVR